jgi:peroxiredoxin Q/BCP
MAKSKTQASAKKKAGKKKPAAKKSAAKKKPAAAKKAPAGKKKPAAKKASASKKATAGKKKPAAKKASASKKKTAASKATKKPAAKQPAAKKASATKKPAAKKASATKKPAAKKAPALAGGKPSTAKPEPSTVALDVGSSAPAFDLESGDGQRRSLANMAGQRFVLYFYPRDNTPGCTTEAKEFSDLAANFEELGVQVFGVSTDNLQSHAKFRDKHGLTVNLLSDPDAEAARAYGAWGSKLMYGKPVVGMIRSTFVIGPDGRIERKYVVRQAAGHAAQVLADIQAELERAPTNGEQAQEPSGPGEVVEGSDPQTDPDDSPEDEVVADEPDNESDDDLDDPSTDDLP